MKVHTNLDNLGTIKNPVVTTGSFDGVHVGHNYIISRLSKIAKEIDGESVLITFYPHPRKVLNPESREMMIYTQREKIETLSKTSLDHLIIINFTLEFAKLSPMDYIRKIIVEKIHAKKVVIGYDHQFGANREGNFDYLYELGRYYDFGVEEIEAQDVKHTAVSSTKIRRALQEGDIVRVNDYLGQKYILIGKVEEGSRFGRRVGFRTANVNIEEDSKLLPQIGVYAVRVDVNGNNHKGLLSVAPAERTKDNLEILKNRFVRVHLLDFDREIYGQDLRITFVERLRDHKRFRNVTSLINQLKVDRQQVERMKFQK